MNELLKALYDSFYKPQVLTKEKQEINDCHQQLIERLDKPERKLVLQIMDCKDQITENRPSTALSPGSVWHRIWARN